MEVNFTFNPSRQFQPQAKHKRVATKGATVDKSKPKHYENHQQPQLWNEPPNWCQVEAHQASSHELQFKKRSNSTLHHPPSTRHRSVSRHALENWAATQNCMKMTFIRFLLRFLAVRASNCAWKWNKSSVFFLLNKHITFLSLLFPSLSLYYFLFSPARFSLLTRKNNNFSNASCVSFDSHSTSFNRFSSSFFFVQYQEKSDFLRRSCLRGKKNKKIDLNLEYSGWREKKNSHYFL